MPKIVIGFVLLCGLSLAGFSQDADWQNLRRLKVGKKIEVVQTNLNVVKGRFVAVSDDRLVLTAQGQELTIPREQVYRVSQKGRGRNALLGMAIGAGTGAVVGLASPELGQGTCAQSGVLRCDNGAQAAMLGVLGGVAGSIVGAALPAHSSTVYRVTKKPAEGSVL